jgi:RNA polymerase-binding transcription factor DksA
MTTNKFGHFKKLLEEEAKTLEGELKTVGRQNPDNPNDWVPVPDELDIDEADENETADRIESVANNDQVLGQLEPRYNEVKAALARIEAGTYGICAKCGEPIEEKRLEANPAATTCMKCMNA